MKIITEQAAVTEPQIRITYNEMTPEISGLLLFLEGKSQQVQGKIKNETYLLAASQIYYFESVDNAVFAYGEDNVYRTDYTLAEAEKRYEICGFFRCNKSFVLNIHKISSLTGMIGNRLNARLENGEHVIISRSYAKTFRERLREGSK